MQVDLLYHVNHLLNKISFLKTNNEVGHKTKLTLQKMSSSQRSKFVSDCCNFYDCFVNYIEKYLDEADLKCQLNILSTFCLLNLNFPNYNDYMKILENFGEMCDFIDHDLLLDEVVTLESSKNNITFSH